MIQKVREKTVVVKAAPVSSYSDISENSAYQTDSEFSDLQPSCPQHNLTGILWLTSETTFTDVPLVQFTPDRILENYKSAIKIYEIICKHFAARNKDRFTPEVMHNWSAWVEREKTRWTPHGKLPSHCSFLQIPAPFTLRQCAIELRPVPSIEDSALADLDDSLEYVCFDSGKYGSFTKKQRIDLVKETLLNQEAGSFSKGPILEKMGCIFKFQYPHKLTNTLVSQIAVGIINKVHGDNSSKDARVDIQFCPAKGAKPQTNTRPDTLYQDISAAMSFNLNYKKWVGSKGRKVAQLDIQKHEPREVLLAYNLHLKKDGTFATNRMISAGNYDVSSLQAANIVIKEYYESAGVGANK